jgi:hypothetical protein
LLLTSAITFAGARARADEAAPPAAPQASVASGAVPPAAAVAPAAPPAAPYSLPWQLRPTAAATVLRSDTSVAFYQNATGSGGATTATMLLGSYKITPSLAPLVRLGFVQNAAPGTAPDGTSFVNPILGLTYAHKLGPSFRAAAFLGGTVPIGQGGGDTPDAGAAAANTAGLRARSAMDNSMFAVNYFTAILGGDAAYVDHRWTVQGEVTLFQLMRVRGEHAGSSTDSTRTNSTAGLHVGAFVIPELSLGAELRYQRWLSTPTQLVMGNKVPIADAAKDTLTVAAGPRAHFSIGKGMMCRPGISYARVLDQPLRASSYNMVQIDLPISF